MHMLLNVANLFYPVIFSDPNILIALSGASFTVVIRPVSGDLPSDRPRFNDPSYVRMY
jgi:hypothetical protein